VNELAPVKRIRIVAAQRSTSRRMPAAFAAASLALI
jgi:hypothetical protein